MIEIRNLNAIKFLKPSLDFLAGLSDWKSYKIESDLSQPPIIRTIFYKVKKIRKLTYNLAFSESRLRVTETRC